MRNLVLLLLVSCSHAEPSTSAPSSGAPPSPAAEIEGKCGLLASDWCPAPPGDPCGDHKDKDSCVADERCGGMPYRGESLVACKFDARGFAENCPAVGCISLTSAR